MTAQYIEAPRQTGNTITGNLLRHSFPKICMALQVLRTAGIRGLQNRLRSTNYAPNYKEWCTKHDPQCVAEATATVQRLENHPSPPRISILLPVFNSDPKFLTRVIQSVREQIYPHWELCIADDASTAPHVREILNHFAEDPRIKIIFRPSNGHISEATNSALSSATGAFVAFLDHDDELPSWALAHVAEAIVTNPTTSILYSDEDKISACGVRHSPHFKSDWNPELILQQNYVCHLMVIRRSLVLSCGGCRKGFEGAQDWDLLLRCTAKVSHEEIHHIPRVLYHWRSSTGSTARSSSNKPYALEAGRRAVESCLEDRGISARVDISPTAPLVSHSYHKPASPPRIRVVIITPSSSAEAITHQQIERERYPLLSPLETIDSSPLRLPVSLSTGYEDLICLLSEGIMEASPGWLESLATLALQPGVGAVGGTIVSPRGTITDGALYCGPGGVYGLFDDTPIGGTGYHHRASLLQDVSAVSASCLLVRRELLKGLPDITALTLREMGASLSRYIRKMGSRVIWTPSVRLTINGDSNDKNTPIAGDLGERDPFYHPALTPSPPLFFLTP